MASRSPITIRKITPSDRGFIEQEMRRWWGDEMIVIHGETIYPSEHDGFTAHIAGETVGLVILRVNKNTCEIISLTTSQNDPRVGKALLDAVISMCQVGDVERCMATTTNDNIGALRFYQQAGFAICDCRIGELNKSRAIKPQIPLIGNYNIPIRDEIELELEI